MSKYRDVDQNTGGSPVTGGSPGTVDGSASVWAQFGVILGSSQEHPEGMQGHAELFWVEFLHFVETNKMEVQQK